MRGGLASDVEVSHTHTCGLRVAPPSIRCKAGVGGHTWLTPGQSQQTWGHFGSIPVQKDVGRRKANVRRFRANVRAGLVQIFWRPRPESWILGQHSACPPTSCTTLFPERSSSNVAINSAEEVAPLLLRLSMNQFPDRHEEADGFATRIDSTTRKLLRVEATSRPTHSTRHNKCMRLYSDERESVCMHTRHRHM